MSTKVGRGLAKALGIKLDYRNEIGLQKENISRGESAFSIESDDTYVEAEPTAGEWLREQAPGFRDILRYFQNLFPFTKWLHRYNAQWLLGDLVAGMVSLFFMSMGRTSSDHGSSRHHHWCRGSASEHGLRQAGRSPCSIRSLLRFHGNPDLLVIRDIERYHHWRKVSSKSLTVTEILTIWSSPLPSCQPSPVTLSSRPEKLIRSLPRT